MRYSLQVLVLVAPVVPVLTDYQMPGILAADGGPRQRRVALPETEGQVLNRIRALHHLVMLNRR